MLRNILASTAIVALMTSGAIAQSETPRAKKADEQTMMQGENARGSGIYEFETDTVAQESARGFLVSNMIGESLMAGEGENAEEIGDINDIIVERDGSVRAVIVGVGGFIGLGEKDVAVDFGRLSFVSSNEDQMRVVSDLSKQELENAPGYERPDNIPNWMSMNRQGEMTQARRDGEMDQVRNGDEMKQTGEGADGAYRTAQDESAAPAQKQMESMSDSDWTAERTEIDTATVSTDALVGASVYTAADTDIGEVSEVLLGQDGQVEAVVIDVGGFLGFGEKPVAVSYDSLRMYEGDGGGLLITASFTEEELDNARSYTEADYKADPDSVTLQN
ncbi:PRC-barrel domain-containing protein [Stappia stellulata]|uniref:PRC-barrel domain-containing protein n=1 Tax=Stappia stellulata TaxID=71235 RepID=UPI00041B9027|nr:PRC-barrel domain-containing protein [Stappia stellulata]